MPLHSRQLYPVRLHTPCVTVQYVVEFELPALVVLLDILFMQQGSNRRAHTSARVSQYAKGRRMSFFEAFWFVKGSERMQPPCN